MQLGRAAAEHLGRVEVGPDGVDRMAGSGSDGGPSSGGPVGHLERVVGQHAAAPTRRRGRGRRACSARRRPRWGRSALITPMVRGSPVPFWYSRAPSSGAVCSKSPLGEEAADLEVGVHALLGPAEHLHHDLVAEDRGACCDCSTEVRATVRSLGGCRWRRGTPARWSPQLGRPSRVERAAAPERRRGWRREARRRRWRRRAAAAAPTGPRRARPRRASGGRPGAARPRRRRATVRGTHVGLGFAVGVLDVQARTHERAATGCAPCGTGTASSTSMASGCSRGRPAYQRLRARKPGSTLRQRAPAPALQQRPASRRRRMTGQVRRRPAATKRASWRLRIEREPVEAVGPEGQVVGPSGDGRELVAPNSSTGTCPRSSCRSRVHALGEAGEVGHDQHRLVLVAAHERQHLGVLGVEELDLAAPEHRVLRRAGR